MNNIRDNERTWNEFRATGLLMFVNMFLHIFGWMIVIESDGSEIKRCYPARTKYKGFTEPSQNKAYERLENFMKNEVFGKEQPKFCGDDISYKCDGETSTMKCPMELIGMNMYASTKPTKSEYDLDFGEINYNASYNIGDRYVNSVKGCDFEIDLITVYRDSNSECIILYGYQNHGRTHAIEPIRLAKSDDIQLSGRFIPEFAIGQRVFCITSNPEITISRITRITHDISVGMPEEDMCITYTAEDSKGNVYTRHGGKDFDSKSMDIYKTFFSTIDELSETMFIDGATFPERSEKKDQVCNAESVEIEPIKFTTPYKVGSTYIYAGYRFEIMSLSLVCNAKGQSIEIRGFHNQREIIINKPLKPYISSVNDKEYEFIPELTIGQKGFIAYIQLQELLNAEVTEIKYLFGDTNKGDGVIYSMNTNDGERFLYCGQQFYNTTNRFFDDEQEARDALPKLLKELNERSM